MEMVMEACIYGNPQRSNILESNLSSKGFSFRIFCRYEQTLHDVSLVSHILNTAE